jgi:long-subunit acyl-CoA synthetase (AMP-forming)
MLFLGIVGAGGRFTGSNPAYTTNELSHHIQNTKARFVITESEFLPTVINLATQESGVHASNVFVLDSSSQGTLRCKPLQDLLVHEEEDWVTFSREDEAKDTTAALLSTSGTTGLPKAAMISHYSCVVANTILADSKYKPYNVSRDFHLST